MEEPEAADMTQEFPVTGTEFAPVLGLPHNVTGSCLAGCDDSQHSPTQHPILQTGKPVCKSLSWPRSPSEGRHIADGAEWRLTGSELKPWTVGYPIPWEIPGLQLLLGEQSSFRL